MEPGHPGTVPRAGFGTLWAGRLLPLLIAAAAFVVFRPALNNDFVNWDDDLYLTGHDNYRGLDWQQIRWMFTTTHGGPYQPLGWLSWAIDHAWWGMNPRGYHLSNMLLHAANAAVFYLVALMVLRRAVTPGASGTTLAVRLGACAAALLFAVHPLRVESVAWATERRDVLSGLFYLLAVLAYLRWCERRSGGDSGRVSGWPAGAFVWFGCALLSKGMSVTLPVVLLILDVYPLRRVGLSLESGRPRLAGAKRAVLEKTPFLLASLVIGCVAVYGVREAGALGTREALVVQRLLTSCYGFCIHLLKTIWPVGLSPLYEYPVDFGKMLAPGLASAAVLAVLCVWAYRWRSRRPGVAAAWVCYLVILAPVSGLLQAGPQVAADRYTYLATMSLAMLVGGGFGRLWGAAGRSKGRIALGGGSLAVAAVLGVLTWKQTLVWRNSTVLWQQVLRTDPDSWHANNNLGIWMAQTGRLDEAVALYERAIETRPGYANAHNNLGNALLQQGRLGQAVVHYSEALRLRPTYAEAHYNLAAALTQGGELTKAIEHYQEVLRLRPDYAEAHNNLGNALLQQGKLAEAVEHYTEASRIDPGWAVAQLNLGNVRHMQGRVAEAVQAFRRAVRIDPGSAAGHYALGRALAEEGKLDEAVADVRAALQIDPQYSEARQWLEGAWPAGAESNGP